MPTLTASSGVPQLDDGMYQATVVDCEEKAATANSPSEDPWLSWVFLLHTGPKTGVELRTSSSKKFGPKAKARLWVEAMLGRKLADDEAVEIEAVLPQDVTVAVRHNDRGYPYVSDVFPAKPKASASAPQGTLI